MDKMVLRKRLIIRGISIFTGITLISFWLVFGPGQRPLPIFPFPKYSQPIVTLRQGTYKGFVLQGTPKNIEEFRGIPYALSTAGERRFAPPVPVGPSSEVFDALVHGYRCMSGNPDPPGHHDQDEECLFVNVMRPQKRPSNTMLPVLIHFYGGSFNFGSGPQRNIADLLGYSALPFIGITFNYRLGAFGFLPSKLTEKEGLLNAGLKDQALLLEWVRDNIAEFGGDPNDVTLMGNSAGAHGV
jgi:acetylcholinesterase